MPNELPRYRIHAPALIPGYGHVGHNPVDLPQDIDLPGLEPRNSWEPLNDAAREAFKARDAKKLAAVDAQIKEAEADRAAALEAGARETEMEGFDEVLSKLRLERAKMPKALKAVPSFGAKPTHSLVFSENVHSEPGKASNGIDEEVAQAKAEGGEEKARKVRMDRILSNLVSGGAGEAEVKAVREAMERAHAGDAAKAIEAAKKPVAQPKKPEPKKPAEDEKPKGEPRASDS